MRASNETRGKAEQGNAIELRLRDEERHRVSDGCCETFLLYSNHINPARIAVTRRSIRHTTRWKAYQHGTWCATRFGARQVWSKIPREEIISACCFLPSAYIASALRYACYVERKMTRHGKVGCTYTTLDI